MCKMNILCLSLICKKQAVVQVSVFQRNTYFNMYIQNRKHFVSLSRTLQRKDSSLPWISEAPSLRCSKLKWERTWALRRERCKLRRRPARYLRSFSLGEDQRYGGERERERGTQGYLTVKSRKIWDVEILKGTEKTRTSCVNSSSSLLSPSLSAAVWSCVRVSKGLHAWEEHQLGKEASTSLHFFFPLWTLLLGSGNNLHPLIWF